MVKKSKSAVTHYILNCEPSHDTGNDWTITSAIAAGMHPAAASPPSSLDLRDDAWWKISNQGETGSCVGWGTVDGLLRWHFVNAGKLNKTEELSVRFIWMAAKETDEITERPTSFIEGSGTTLKAALDIARKYGIVTATILPFQNVAGHPQLFISPVPNDPSPENTFYAIAAQRRISSYINLGKGTANWRAWIANNGPILTRLEVDSTWNNAFNSNGNLDVYDPSSSRGGHCVVVVGYTPDRFIIRNSWNINWGDKGYAYASNDYANQAFTESYGVTI
ncbi:C1 family peptidase [Citrobacter youngae]|uniref:C1 family peptidase n=1 Tax=Citrobacter youngae TaxID=133448 RepID=UPI003EE11FC8